MIVYKDKTWCDAKQCKNYHSCGEALPYAMCQQTKECPADAGFRLPYAVRDMSDECNDYEVEE